MAHSSNGDKASTPNGYYHLPNELFIENGFMEVKKTDENGKALAGAVFVATNQKTGKAYKIGPTNASGYAKAADPIPFGTYTVKETVFPKDYRAYGKSEWTVTLNKNTPNATITIKAVNELIPGSAKIVKVSEDGKVDGITFRIQGNGIDKTVKTANGGVIQVDNLKPGVYTVTETEYDKYIPQEVRRVTVVSGQVSTVNFSYKLRRGDLTVKKTAEDGLTEGMKLRLYGTSISGIEVNEYAVTDKNGVAKFKDVLIGTGYTLEEVDTPNRYVVPDKQTAAVEWNKVTSKAFDNVLKKFSVTVTKSDSENGLPQGNASLAGAKYGIYKGNQLIDTYTTDANGQFTTKYYICGDDWSLKEISPSEGYLLNTESQHIGAEAKLYTVEYNLAKPLDSLEGVIKGKIAVIKHCDDGTTKIETPEKGAGFEVYLKAAGSYENAEETERDILVCDENGFAETKDLPYGEYIVKQTKGWEGKELLAPFNVFVKENGETYRFLINNATFEALIEIVKKDAETGKIIPAAGIGFKVRDTDTGEYIVQHINYESKETALKVYTESRPERLPLSQNKEFKSVKNMVIAEAMKLNLPTDEVEETDEPVEPDSEPTAEEAESPDPPPPPMDEYERTVADADKGNKWSQYRAAKFMLDRYGDHYDPKKAVEYLTRSAKQGYTVSVPQLVKMTGASRGFFYKNPIVRAEIDRAMEQQAGTINPRRGILDKAMEGRIDLLQEEIFRLRQENQALRDENQRLQKIISKKSRSEFRSL